MSGRYKLHKVKSQEMSRVTVNGHRRFEYLNTKPDKYLFQRRDFAREFGVVIPMFEKLKAFGRRKDLRVLTKRVLVTVEFRGSLFIQFEFMPGYITDLASVPWFFRSIVDNDDEQLIAAVLVHDFLFSTHALPFEVANDLLLDIAVEQGYPRWRAGIAYVSVSSIFGKKRWNDNTARDAWTRKRAAMMLPRTTYFDGVKCSTLPMLPLH